MKSESCNAMGKKKIRHFYRPLIEKKSAPINRSGPL